MDPQGHAQTHGVGASLAQPLTLRPLPPAAAVADEVRPGTQPQPAVQAPSFDALYEDHFGYVWNVCRRLGVPEKDLEDACHDVFVAVHRHLAEYDPSRPVKPWLCGISARVAANHRRKAPNRHEVMGEDVPEPSFDGRTLDDDRAARQLVAAALDTLDEDRRVTLVLHDVEGHSVPELAYLLQEPEGTLYSRLRTARQQFAAAVKTMLWGRAKP